MARSLLQLPDDAGGLDERIKQQRRRVERVLTFLQEVEAAVRQDLALLHRQGLVVGTLVTGLEAAAAMRREAQAAYEACAGFVGQEQLAMLERVDLETAGAALQRLRDQVQAPALDPVSGSAAPSAGPAGHRAARAPAGPTGARAVTAPLPPPVRAVQPTRGAPTGAFQRDRAAAGLADRAFLHGRKGFEAAFRLGTELLGYVTPRLTMVQAALGVTGLPGPRRPWEEVAQACPQAASRAGIAPPMAPWVPKLAKLFHTQVDVARKAFVAVNHWTSARELHRDAETLAGRLGTLPPATEAALVQNFPTGRYYGALFPLGNLHLHFEGVPHMAKLFPPREQARS